MTGNNILEYTPGQAKNFVDHTIAQVPAKEDKKKSKKDEREEREEAARGRERDRRNRDMDRNANRDNRDRGAIRDRSRSRFRETELGRFPSNWKLAIDNKGDDLCISYQMGNCKKNEKDCPKKMVHLCATVVKKTEPPTLCLESHSAKDCGKRKK